MSTHRAGPPKSRRFIGLAGNAATCLYDTDDEKTFEAQCRNKFEPLVWRNKQDILWAEIASFGRPRLEDARPPMNEIGPFKQLPKGEG
jgi:hypothetical protein